MKDILRPILELLVVLPGLLLGYFPVKTYLKQSPGRLAAWLFPLMACLCIGSGLACYRLHASTVFALAGVALAAICLYTRTLTISLWKSGTIALSVCAVFACVNSLSRAVSAAIIRNQQLPPDEPWLCLGACVFYNAVCWIIVLAAYYPATHAVRAMVEDDNFAQTWYVFWVLPLAFILLNLFMIPRYQSTLQTGRVLQGYIVLSSALLVFMFCFLAKSQEMRAVGKAAIVPVCFAVNEPLLFAAPIVLNPVFFVPFVFAPIANIWILKIFIDFLGMNGFMYTLPWTVPGPIGTIMGLGFQPLAFVMLALILVVDFALYYPFFRAYDAQKCTEEAEISQEELAAKNAETLRIINEKIRDREMDKRYLCVTVGAPQPPKGRVEVFLVKDEKKKEVSVHTRPVPGGKTAVTTYETLERRGELALVEVGLETGRTHQIRATFAHMGCPLLGDGKYGRGDVNRRYGETRQALYSYKLTFDFPTDAGILNYLRSRTFQVERVPFRDKYFG